MFLSVCFAILNALRGGGFIARISCALGMGLSVAALAGYRTYNTEYTVIMFFIAFIGMWVGLVLGWGKYLNVAFPNMKYVNEIELKPVDWLTTKLYKFPVNEFEFSNWCFIAFFFRSMLFYPIFIMLSFYNIYALYWGIGVLLMPALYWLRRYTPEVYSVRIAEFSFGGLLGALIYQSIPIVG